MRERVFFIGTQFSNIYTAVGKDKHWVLLGVCLLLQDLLLGLQSRDSALSHYVCIRRRPDFLFCCFIEVTMTVVKSVSDGLRD
jgi:hypothetical protein